MPPIVKPVSNLHKKQRGDVVLLLVFKLLDVIKSIAALVAATVVMGILPFVFKFKNTKFKSAYMTNTN